MVLELVWDSPDAVMVVVELCECRDLVEEMDLVEGTGR